MIQLFIDQTELNLSEDLEFQLIDSNPLITETGEYSFDITISLLEPRNAKAFRHINRINNNDVKTEYDADLIIDLVVRKGTATVLSHTDSTVTIQLLFGNAEMNFSIEEDKKIWELDWGTWDTDISFELALDTIRNPHYTRNYVCTPVMVGETIVNDYSLRRNNNETFTGAYINGVDNVIPQPYLLYYINRLPALLGFSLNTNILNSDSRAQKMFVLNAVNSNRYADALPDMTISEFVDEIENFFNVRFLVNGRTKEMSIVRLKEALQQKKTVPLKNVINSYERTMGSEVSGSRLGFTRISYDVGNAGMYRFLKLSDEIVEKCQIREYPTLDDFRADFQNIPTSDTRRFIIYRIIEDGHDYIFGHSGDQINLRNIFFLPRLPSVITYSPSFFNVNKLKDSEQGSDESVLKLRLVPAEFRQVQKMGPVGNSVPQPIHYQMPKSSIDNIFQPQSQDIIETIEEGVIEVSRTRNIETAFFAGMLRACIGRFDVVGGSRWRDDLLTHYPYSNIDVLPEFAFRNLSGSMQFTQWLDEEWKVQVKHCFKLNGENNILSDYQTEQFLDMSKEYVFTALDSREIDSDNIFEYNGQRYMPIRFERKASNTKKHPVTGYFYRMV